MTNSRSQKGFTLIELLVVIAIIGLLSSIVMTSLSTARSKSRDTKRKADIVQLQKALELYFEANGGYPSTGGAFYGASVNGGSRGVTGAGGYIPNLAPTYVGRLPLDPSGLTTGWSGYLYASDGTHYKILVYGTPETWPTSTQPFYDPARPGVAWMVCSTGSANACNNW